MAARGRAAAPSRRALAPSGVRASTGELVEAAGAASDLNGPQHWVRVLEFSARADCREASDLVTGLAVTNHSKIVQLYINLW